MNNPCFLKFFPETGQGFKPASLQVWRTGLCPHITFHRSSQTWQLSAGNGKQHVPVSHLWTYNACHRFSCHPNKTWVSTELLSESFNVIVEGFSWNISEAGTNEMWIFLCLKETLCRVCEICSSGVPDNSLSNSCKIKLWQVHSLQNQALRFIKKITFLEPAGHRRDCRVQRQAEKFKGLKVHQMHLRNKCHGVGKSKEKQLHYHNQGEGLWYGGIRSDK